MVKVLQVPGEGAPREGESCLIIARDASGRFYRFASYERYMTGAGTSDRDVDEEELQVMIDSAVAVAQRDGIPAVYVDRR